MNMVFYGMEYLEYPFGQFELAVLGMLLPIFLSTCSLANWNVLDLE